MIYIVKHRECFSPNVSGYGDLGVGKLFQHKGDNINYLNPYINEATALYDIWKNSKDKIVGMCHYRRFFEKDGEFLTLKDAEDILKEHEIITSVDFTPPVTPYELLSRAIDPHTLKKYIPKLPEDFQKWISEPNSFNICNMFVCKRTLLNKYCEWLFPVIIPMAEEFMKEDSTGRFKDDRALGFFCEMMFGYWCRDLDKCKMNIKIIEV